MATAPEARTDAAESAGAAPNAFPRRIDLLIHRLFFLIPLGIAGNIIFTLATTDRSALASLVHNSPGYLVIAALCSVLPWFTDAARMSVWSAFLGRRVPYGALLQIVAAAELGAAVLPPATGGTPVKAALLMRRGFTGGAALSLTLLAGLEDWAFFLIMLPVAITLSSAWDLAMVQAILGAAGSYGPLVLAGIGLGVVVARIRKKRRRSAPLIHTQPVSAWARFRENMRRTWRELACVFQLIAARGKARLLVTMALTAIQWTCRFSVVTLLMIGLGAPVQPLLFLALQVVVFGLAVFVPTPGAAGGAEALFYALYRPFVEGETIGLVTAGWRFLTFYFLIILALVVSAFSSDRLTKKEGASTSECPECAYPGTQH